MRLSRRRSDAFEKPREMPRHAFDGRVVEDVGVVLECPNEGRTLFGESDKEIELRRSGVNGKTFGSQRAEVFLRIRCIL
jgi:hypothetical protein